MFVNQKQCLSIFRREYMGYEEFIWEVRSKIGSASYGKP